MMSSGAIERKFVGDNKNLEADISLEFAKHHASLFVKSFDVRATFTHSRLKHEQFLNSLKQQTECEERKFVISPVPTSASIHLHRQTKPRCVRAEYKFKFAKSSDNFSHTSA